MMAHFLAPVEPPARQGLNTGEPAILGLRWNQNNVKMLFPEVSMEAEAEEELRARLAELKQQHRDLDAAIASLENSASRDQLHLTRLKKQKLLLKDQIQKLIDRLIPPIIA
jgi:hypothetical protein